MLPTAASVNKLPHHQAFCKLHRLSPFNRLVSLTSPGVYLGVQSLQAKCSHARTSPCVKHIRGCVHRVAAMSEAHAQQELNTQTSVEIVIITTVGCQFCKRAKDTLKQAGLDYREIEASNQPQLLNKIKETTGRRTVPQVCQRSQS